MEMGGDNETADSEAHAKPRSREAAKGAKGEPPGGSTPKWVIGADGAGGFGLTRSGARGGQEVGGKSEVYPQIPGRMFADWDWGEAPEIWPQMGVGDGGLGAGYGQTRV